MSDTPVLMLARTDSYDSSIQRTQETPRTPRVTTGDVTRSAENLLMTLAQTSPKPPSSPNVKRPNTQDFKGPYYECIALRNENEVLKKKVKELEKQQNLRCKIAKEAPKLIGLINSLSKEGKRGRMVNISLQKQNIELAEELDIQKDQNKQAFREISELTCSISCMLAGTPMPTIIPEYPSGDGLTEKDIKLVIEQACVGRAIAIEALEKNNGDLVDAIMDLTMLN